MTRPPILVAALLCCALAAAQEAPDLAINGSFEQEGGWELVLQQGAEGALEYDTAMARSGQRSLKLTKTNGRGYVVLRSVAPVSPEAAATCYFRGWFHADEAPVSSVLMFRVKEKDANLSYDAIDRSYGWSAGSFIVPAPRPRRVDERLSGRAQQLGRGHDAQHRAAGRGVRPR